MKTVFGLTAAVMALSAVANAQEVLSNYPTRNFLKGTVATGSMPKGMVTTLDGKKLYVADMDGRRINGKREASVTIIDAVNIELHKAMVTPAGPRPRTLGNIEVAMTDDGRYALVSRLDGCGPGGNVCPSPSYTPSEGLPYPMVFAIDTKTDQIVKMIPTRKPGYNGGMGPKVIAVRPKQSPAVAYVANYFSHDITIMDIRNLGSGPVKDSAGERIVGAIKLTSSVGKKISPRGIAFSGDGRYAIVAGASSNSLFVIDTVKHKQIAELVSPTKAINFRHIVVNHDASVAYISHMVGDSISRINLRKLIQIAESQSNGGNVVLPQMTWREIFIPFPTASGPVNFSKLDLYPGDHPNFPNQRWFRSNPNTIVLDPVNERYLYVSFRTTGKDYDGIDDKKLTPMNQMGKVDIIDVQTGKTVKSLISGVEPTALAVSPDNKTLMSSGFRDNKIYFYDLQKIISTYERNH